MRLPLLRTARSIAGTSLAFAIITIAGTSDAFAQNAAAEALFSDGERLLKEGNVGAACDAFEGSNRIEARAGTLVNLGLCREQNGQLASAWSAFKDAATRAKDPKKKQIADERIAAIEPKLSYLTISVADESRIDGLVVTRNGQPIDAALWNRAVPIDGGTHHIGGRAPGHEEWTATVEVPKENGKISVEVPRFKEIAKLVTPAPAPAPAPVVIEKETPPPSMFTGKRKIALGVAAGGVLVFGAGIVFGMQASGFEDDAFALCPDPAQCTDADEANDLMEKGRSRALLANVSYGVAVGAAAGAVVLWFLGAPTATSSSIAITPRTGEVTGADVSFRF
jgi:hypothetical protein